MAICAQCSFDNPSGMRYCGNCGALLEQGVPTGASTPPPPGTPAGLVGEMVGADLLERFRRAGLEARGQRRNVTVLFADLSGYTGLAEQLDNEDVFDLIQQFIRLLVNDVYTYEGLVDKMTGDGIMALFGAPIAHENNAERAVRSALAMQTNLEYLASEAEKRFGIDLHMRIGLHSGSVIVGGIGSNLMMDYTAIGDTVNLARRLQEQAEPGTILVSESVQHLTSRQFEYRLEANLQLKGLSHPVNAYTLLAPRARPGSPRGLEGLHSPMVGRDAELNRLQQALDALIHHKKGQLVVITGEAGIGKSRLTAELKLLAQGAGELRLLEGSSLTYRRSVSYWIFLDLLRAYLGVAANTREADVRRRLVTSVQHALGGRAIEALPYLESLFSLKPSNPAASHRLRYLDASQFRRQTFLAVRDLLVAEAQRSPLLIILEDLHWADEASMDLLLYLLDLVRSAPIMIYTISRPFEGGILNQIVDWGNSQIPDSFTSIHLQSLSLDQSGSLLLNLLALTEFPQGLRQHIIQRAAGVPFYLEEILRMLIDKRLLQKQGDTWQVDPSTSIQALGVPDTLQGLILARFDRLDDFQRRILQVAAVIGHQFSQPILQAMLASPSAEATRQALDFLVEREYIHPVTTDPQPVFTFRHILMSEAIYSTLLRRERASLHELAGKVIEDLYIDRLEEHVEILARHYSWSNNQERALHYLILAGNKSATSFMNIQARQLYEQALALLPHVDHTLEQSLRVYTGLGDIQSLVGEYQGARELYIAGLQGISSDASSSFIQQRSLLQRKIAKTYERQGQHDKALYHLGLAQESLQPAPSALPEEYAQILNDTGWIYFRQGNFPEAQRLLDEALAQVENSTAYDAIASIYNRLGGLAYNQGDWNRTADYLRKSIAIRETIGDLVGLATSFNNLGLLGIEMGDFDRALENLTRSYELNNRLGQAEGISMALNNLGWLRLERGETEEARQCLDQALALARQIGYSALEAQVLKNFGELELAQQDWEQARTILQDSVALFTELGAHDQLLDTCRLLGEAALGAGDIHHARACLDKIQQLALSLGNETTDLSTVQRGELWRFRGMLAAHQGQWETASQYLRESEKIFQSLGSRLYQGRAAHQIGALSESLGDRRTANLRYREAALLFNSVGARLEEQRSRAAYQNLDQ